MKTQYGEICCRLTFGWMVLRALSAAPPPAQNYRSSWWKTTAAHPKDVIWPPKMLGFHGEVEIRRIRGNGSSSFNRPCEQKLGIRFDQSNRNKQMLRCFIVIWSSDDPLILLNSWSIHKAMTATRRLKDAIYDNICKICCKICKAAAKASLWPKEGQKPGQWWQWCYLSVGDAAIVGDNLRLSPSVGRW